MFWELASSGCSAARDYPWYDIPQLDLWGFAAVSRCAGDRDLSRTELLLLQRPGAKAELVGRKGCSKLRIVGVENYAAVVAVAAAAAWRSSDVNFVAAVG